MVTGRFILRATRSFTKMISKTLGAPWSGIEMILRLRLCILIFSAFLRDTLANRNRGIPKGPRIIKNSVRSIAPDGLFFVILDGNKKGRYPRARHAGASIYHYGHCRKIEFTNRKLRQVGKFWGLSTTCSLRTEKLMLLSLGLMWAATRGSWLSG